jgi:chorismate mutase
MSQPDFLSSSRIAILGLGLMRGSLALALHGRCQSAREMGWNGVPMICSREIPVPGGLACCICVLLQWNTDLPQHAIRHVYLGAAASLRPDLSVTEISK